MQFGDAVDQDLGKPEIISLYNTKCAVDIVNKIIPSIM